MRGGSAWTLLARLRLTAGVSERRSSELKKDAGRDNILK